MKLVPITGLIETIHGPIKVEGFAFQVPGFEWFRTWATPQLAQSLVYPPRQTGRWVVSEWLTGKCVNGYWLHESAPQEAAEAVAAWFQEVGVDEVRKRYLKAMRALES